MDRSRIPKTLVRFHEYISRVNNFLPAIDQESGLKNGIRLGLSQDEIDRVNDFFGQWYSDDASQPGAYRLHTNRNTKTGTTRLTVVEVMKNFSAYFSPLLWRLSGSGNLRQGDYTVLNISPRNAHRTKHTVAISETVFVSVKPTGSGWLHCSMRTSHDSTRPSIAANADSIQLALKIGDPAPLNPQDGTQKLLFTRASFRLDAGYENAGKKLHLYARWYVTRHPHLSGPWSQVRSLFIS